MSAVKIKRLTVVAAPGDTARAGALARELERLLRQPVAGGGVVSPQRKISIVLTPTGDAGVERLASQIAAELRRKLGQVG
jgi:vacuolar-type H+-ATPase subunit E/Vma4